MEANSSLTWATAAETGVHDDLVPVFFGDMMKFSFLPSAPSRDLSIVVSRCTLDMIRDRRAIKPEEKQAIFNILTSLSYLKPFTKAHNDTFRLKNLLLAIQGQLPSAKGPYAYPEPLCRNAVILSDRLGREVNNGWTAINMDSSCPSIGSSAFTHTQSAPVNKASSSSGIPSSHQSIAEGADTEVKVQRELVPIMDADLQSMMTGILIAKPIRPSPAESSDSSSPQPRSASKSYVFDYNAAEEFRRPFDVVGHNGLDIGQWWPLQRCAMRDGAHGSAVGGIAGNAASGAFSIVLSGGYEGMDEDYGDMIYYSGSGSHENTDPSAPNMTNGNKAMRFSHDNDRPIRLLRGRSRNKAFAPERGLRYDGLYKIVEEEIKTNEKGGAFIRFKLCRLKGQPDIDLSRPTPRELELLEKLKAL